MTVIFHHEQIKKIISLNESLIPIIENAFESLSSGKTVMPPLANYLITMFKETPLLAAITVVELFSRSFWR